MSVVRRLGDTEYVQITECYSIWLKHGTCREVTGDRAGKIDWVTLQRTLNSKEVPASFERQLGTPGAG